MRGATVSISLALLAAGALASAGPVSAQPRLGPEAGSLRAPRVVATGTRILLRGEGAAPRARVVVERARRGGGWRRLAETGADGRGGWTLRVRPRRLASRYRFRAVVPGAAPSPAVRVLSRDVTLDAVGDINLGDGVADVMEKLGVRHPWSGVARELRSADVAFGNLECSVSTRGRPVAGKEYTFRGRPAALGEAARYAGIDVLNLANNHTADFGPVALLDTVHWLRRFGIEGPGAGRNLAAASRPRVLHRLGLRIAFVGFSDVNPAGFGAGPRRPGTVLASPATVVRGVRRAARRGHVVVAAFHWGVERSTRPTGRQRALARAALAGGASAVIGTHPHVLQPVVRRARAAVAYSLGNFVWAAGGGITSRTGILRLRLSTRGVEGMRFLPAHISGTRPVLTRARGSAMLSG